MPLPSTEMPRAQSLQSRLRGAMETRQASTITPKVIPGSDLSAALDGGRLVGKFRTPTVAEVEGIAERVKDDLSQNAEMLLTTCEGVEILLPTKADPELHQEAEDFNAHGYKLGLELAAYLGIEGCQSEREAVLQIIPEWGLVSLSRSLIEAWGIADEEIAEDLAKN